MGHLSKHRVPHLPHKTAAPASSHPTRQFEDSPVLRGPAVGGWKEIRRRKHMPVLAGLSWTFPIGL